MIKLMLAQPGAGKSHWLAQQNANVVVDCTNKSHRAILCTIADTLGYQYPSRASIDDVLRIIAHAPAQSIALDNIDRTSVKICYTLLALSGRHQIYATATTRKRVTPLLDRQAAILVPPPAVHIKNIISARYPNLTPRDIARIAQIASNPAAAINLAEAIQRGETQLPPPPAKSLYPLVLICALAILAYLRYTDLLSPVTLALVSGVALWIRRLLWLAAKHD